MFKPFASNCSPELKSGDAQCPQEIDNKQVRLVSKLETQLPIRSLMKCLWPSKGRSIVGAESVEVTLDRSTARRTHRIRAPAMLLAALSTVQAWSSVVVPQGHNPLRVPLSQAERSLRRVPAHISEFNPVSEPLALSKCGSVRPPEALLSPDPLLPAEDDGLLVRVSFIVGSDGHVHSAFVLNSAGADEDERVLRAVRQWRYRPALCNGVPTDSEARVRFSIR